jgi:glycolate oxidase FAD binding subunit
MQRIAQSHLLTQAVQLRSDTKGFHLDIQLSAHPDARHSEALRSMTQAANLDCESNSHSVWSARQLLLSRPDRLLLKATMLPTEVSTFAQEVEEKGGECVAQTFGILYTSFPADELSFKLAEEFRYHIGLQGGTTFLITRTPSASAAETWAFVAERELPNAVPLMHEIKRRFDPNRTLNPGRFLGGI